MDRKSEKFVLNGEPIEALYVETQTVKDGVECDIYAFVDDTSKDLAIVRVTKGYKTPVQRILLGTKTIEGYMDGSGTLTVATLDDEVTTYTFGPDKANEPIAVEVGQTMQWLAKSDLVFYEVCEPPYEDGRFENLPEPMT